jgi:hypothetical protein
MLYPAEGQVDARLRGVEIFYDEHFLQPEGFAKTKRYKNSNSARPLTTLLTACNLPQRASRRSASTDRLSSVGLSNSLLVGRITNSVNGMTLTSRLQQPATRMSPRRDTRSGTPVDLKLPSSPA